MNSESVALSNVLKEIERQTGLSFFFSNELIDVSKGVTLKVTNETLENVLYKLFGNNYTFGIRENYIVIGKKTAAPPPQQPVIKKKIEGIVIDASGVPIAGVNVIIKGSKNGMATNEDGRFYMEFLSDKSAVLQFSCIGFISQEINIEGKQSIKIVLKENQVALEDIIVTGYANIDRNNFTGSAIKIKREDLLKSSPGNIIQSLQLFDPSFKIVQNNEMGSNPNTMPEIYIRGRSGIGNTEITQSGELSQQNLRNNPNLPTFILDGFEVGVDRIYDLDPTRIESVTILKDAASTAIYGARAANGVIVIETVKPKEGRLRVNYALNGSITFPDLSDYNLLNAREKLELERVAGIFDPRESENPNIALQREQSYYEKMMEINSGVNTYWLSKPLRTELNHKHNVLIEGGSKEFIIGLDLKLGVNDGVMIGSGRNTNALGFSVSYRKNRIQFNNYLEWNNLQAKESPYGSFSTYAALNPYDRYLDENGNYMPKLTQWYGHPGISINPLYDATLKSYNRTIQNEFTNNFNFKWFISNELRFDSRIAISNSRSEQQIFKDPASSEFANVTDYLKKGYKSISNNSYSSVDANAFLFYVKSIKKHQVNFTLGGNIKETNRYSSSFTVTGFPSGTTDDVSFGAQILNKPSGMSDVTRTVGFFSSLNYTFDNTYLIDFSGRYDGASQFGNNSKFAPFWSLGFGVNVHSYRFIKENFHWINNFKLRTNYGQLGKANFSQSLSKSTYNYNFDQWYIDGIGAIMQSLGNPDLEWEKTRMFDVGFDLTIFKKLSLTAGYYHKNTIDLIGDITLPLSAGFSSFKSNLGEIVNQGFELNARLNVVNKKDLNLDIYGTASHNENRFVKIHNALKEYNRLVEEYYRDHNTVNKPLMKYYEGASQTAIYAMRSIGINPADGKEIYLNADGTPTYEWNESQLVVVGDTEPAIRGAFGLNFSYKSVYLFTGFLYEFGGEQYNSTLVSKVENANVYYNVDKRVFTDRWQKPGDVTFLKDIKDWNTPTKVTSRFVQKNNTVSFNSITLGYNVPRKILSKYKIENCKIQLTANDLLYLSTVERERGTSYPFARTVNISVNLNF
jgi:TonB-linked SusC/RagA family outer membrane protein